MIPKIIHQIWIGRRKLSSEHAQMCQQWKDMYPDYKHVFWDNDAVATEDIVSKKNQSYFLAPHCPIALKADILRYEIVRKCGGIYIDVDTEPLKRMDESILTCRFFGGIQTNEEVAIGIFGAEPQCPLIVDACEKVGPNIDFRLKSGSLISHVDHLSGPVFFTNICKPYRALSDYQFMPPKFFYPYWFTETHRRYEDFKSTCPDAYSAHHWSKNWYEHPE